MKPFAIALCAALLVGCSHSPDRVSAGVVGTYAYGAFDLSFYLTLKADGTFEETERGPLVVLGPNGEHSPLKRRDRGKFVERNDRVILYSESGSRRMLRRVDGPRILLREMVRGNARDYVVKKPNQSSEPTPTAGTSAAEQPLVPAAVVAHL